MRFRSTLAATAALSLVVGGVAVAAAESTGDTFHGCLKKGNIVEVSLNSGAAVCKSGETPVSWGSAGPQGPQGPEGPQGPRGFVGPQGEVGPSGASTPSQRWYRDADGDGFGDWYDFLDSPAQPEGYVANNDDCHDNQVLANPDRTVDDGTLGPAAGGTILIDADCDGIAAEDREVAWYFDEDFDGYGAGDPIMAPRSRSPGAGYVRTFDDCAPTNPSLYFCGRTDFDGDGENAIYHGGADCDDYDAQRYSDGFDFDGIDRDCDLSTGGVIPYDPAWYDPRVPAPGPLPQQA